MRRALVLVVLVLAGVPARAANELRVDRSTVRTNDVVTVTVTLEGEFARADDVALPVKNLEILGEPSVSSEFSWVNGQSRRTKVFRFRARAGSAGPAVVGPVELTAGSLRHTLRAVSIDVVEDRAATSNDPEVILQELLDAGRDPLFVTVAADRSRVSVGEPVVITWYLFNGANVQQSRILRVPPMRDFWVEELDEARMGSTRERVAEMLLERVPVRSVAVIPLRSGRFEVEGLVVEAAVMRRIRGGPLSIFEGTVEEITYTSPHVVIDAVAIPPGPPVDATGTLQLQCGAPKAKGEGPVSFEAALSGRGNVRSAVPPAFASPIRGRSQIEELGVNVASAPAFSMTRRWRYLVFPARTGELEVPPLRMTVFDPATGSRRELRCGGGTVHAVAVRAPVREGTPVSPRRVEWKRHLPAAAAVVLLLAAVAAGMPALVRAVRVRGEVRRLLRGTPGEARGAIAERLGDRAAVLEREPGERGEAYRALQSLLLAAERDHAIAAGWKREAARRLRDVLSER